MDAATDTKCVGRNHEQKRIRGSSVEFYVKLSDHLATRRCANTAPRRMSAVFEVREKGFKGLHKRERFTNELALVYEDGRTLVLGEEKKKEDGDAECTPAPGTSGVPAEQ